MHVHLPIDLPLFWVSLESVLPVLRNLLGLIEKIVSPVSTLNLAIGFEQFSLSSEFALLHVAFLYAIIRPEVNASAYVLVVIPLARENNIVPL